MNCATSTFRLVEPLINFLYVVDKTPWLKVPSLCAKSFEWISVQRHKGRNFHGYVISVNYDQNKGADAAELLSTKRNCKWLCSGESGTTHFCIPWCCRRLLCPTSAEDDKVLCATDRCLVRTEPVRSRLNVLWWPNGKGPLRLGVWLAVFQNRKGDTRIWFTADSTRMGLESEV